MVHLLGNWNNSLGRNNHHFVNFSIKSFERKIIDRSLKISFKK